MKEQESFFAAINLKEYNDSAINFVKEVSKRAGVALTYDKENNKIRAPFFRTKSIDFDFELKPYFKITKSSPMSDKELKVAKTIAEMCEERQLGIVEYKNGEEIFQSSSTKIDQLKDVSKNIMAKYVDKMGQYYEDVSMSSKVFTYPKKREEFRSQKMFVYLKTTDDVNIQSAPTHIEDKIALEMGEHYSNDFHSDFYTMNITMLSATDKTQHEDIVVQNEFNLIIHLNLKNPDFPESLSYQERVHSFPIKSSVPIKSEHCSLSTVSLIMYNLYKEAKLNGKEKEFLSKYGEKNVYNAEKYYYFFKKNTKTISKQSVAMKDFLEHYYERFIPEEYKTMEGFDKLECVQEMINEMKKENEIYERYKLENACRLGKKVFGSFKEASKVKEDTMEMEM